MAPFQAMDESKGIVFGTHTAIVAGLKAAAEFAERVWEQEQRFGGAEFAWQVSDPNNAFQASLVRWYADIAQTLGNFTAEELAAYAHWDYQEINRILVEQGYPQLQLQPWNSDSKLAFGFVAVLKWLGLWVKDGIISQQLLLREEDADGEIRERTVSGFKLRAESHRIQFFKKGTEYGSINPTIKGDWAYVLVHPEPLLTPEAVEEKAQRLVREKLMLTDRFNAGIFPYFQGKKRVNLEQLRHMQYGEFWVNQARLEVEIIFGHDGASYKAAVAGSTQRCHGSHAANGELSFNQPLLVVFKRANGTVGSAYIPTQAFNKESLRVETDKERKRRENAHLYQRR